MKWYAGIDLGTTNSAISSFDGESLRLHKSPEQNDVTPSAIFYDRRGHKYIGQRAYDSAAHSPTSSAVRFKRLMGSRTPIRIESAGLSLTPEQCSADILRALFSYLGEEEQSVVAGTVITVPAAFDQVQKEATMEAARLAAIGPVALMQEPVAAVMSVVRARPEDGRFLVFDLGGGTLDVALAESISGRVSLLTHGGIAVCGGRDFDRAILEMLVFPWLRNEFDLPDATWDAESGIERLASWAVERAKIELSSRDSANIALTEAEMRLSDRKGREVYVDIPVTRLILDGLIRPRLEAAVAAAQSTLADAGVSAADVERIVFVGGPTQYRPLREMVSAALGIPASNDVNPMTAVAEGAALFAESLDWSSETRARKSVRGSVSSATLVQVAFAFSARTPGTQGRVVAKLQSPVPDGSEFQIDGIESGWSSGRVPLKEGASVEVPLSKMGENAFKVFLFVGGSVVPHENKLVMVRTAATVDGIPSSHSLGVEVLEKLGGRPRLAYLVKAGEALPKKDRIVLKATESLKPGGTGSINIKLWEGDIGTPVTDNRFIGAIKVCGADLDGGAIAAGDDLQCDFEILDSGTFSVTISVPRIGATISSGRNFYSPQDGQVDLSSASLQVSDEGRSMLDRLSGVAAKVDDPRIASTRDALQRVAEMNPESSNPEDCKEAMETVLDAKRLLSETRATHLQVLRQIDFDALRDYIDRIRTHARPTEIQSLDGLLESARRVMTRETGDFEAFEDEAWAMVRTILWRQDWYVVDRFRSLSESPHLFVDQADFELLVVAGMAALEAADVERLREIVAHLSSKRIGWAAPDELSLNTNVVLG